ncbi:MAG: LysR family transcriptional regulator [Hyphomicrobiales bacterium]|nr:LysR family transcriptional regulator [Hyphomicrobiales bacterium]PCH51626.1 MAG: LysR family transcriptional regulator [Hyphomicrobiales bacterium]
MDNWDDVKLVLEIERNNGLSGAARALGVNHSTISRRLAIAEDKLGARLFDRLPQGLLITDAGRKVTETALRIEKEMHVLGRNIIADDKALKGTLKVTAAQLIIQVQLAEIVHKFMVLHPAIQVNLSAVNDVVNLHQREADVAIRISKVLEPSLFGSMATKQNRGFYASKKFVEQNPVLLSSDPIELTMPFITFQWWGNAIPAELKARFLNPKFTMQMDDMISVHTATKAGIGISRMPCFLGDSDKDLMRIPHLELSPYTDIWVLTHPDLKNVERIRQFMKFATSEIRKKSGLYLGEVN